jgi:phosphotriesterase-related protein
MGYNPGHVSYKEPLMSAITVLGEREPRDLGTIATHEHVFVDVWSAITRKGAASRTTQITRNALLSSRVEMRVLGELRIDCSAVLDNMVLSSEELAVQELLEFKKYGGDTIVDLTNASMGRDVVALQRISRLTGLNIITSTGYYIQASHPDEVESSTEAQLAGVMIREITEGIDSTPVRAGVIGEIGVTDGVQRNEAKVLRAAAAAQKETGAAVYIHTWPFGHDGLPAVSTFAKAGGDVSRAVVCHVDGHIDLDYTRALLDRGAYVGFEHFGKEFKEIRGREIHIVADDVERLKGVQTLIGMDKAYIRKILFSTDRCLKSELLSYGGFGYAHVLKTIIPWMRILGFTEEQITTLVVDNPKAVVALKK